MSALLSYVNHTQIFKRKRKKKIPPLHSEFIYSVKEAITVLFKELAVLAFNFCSELTFMENTHKSMFVSQANVSHIHLLHEGRHRSRNFQEITNTFSTLSHPQDCCSLHFSLKSSFPVMVLHSGITPLFAYMGISWSLLEDLALWSDFCKTRSLDIAFI